MTNGEIVVKIVAEETGIPEEEVARVYSRMRAKNPSACPPAWDEQASQERIETLRSILPIITRSGMEQIEPTEHY